jgi:NADH-quinone oxidoreductase subunit J
MDMGFAVFAFYLFAFVVVASGVMVVFARSAVHSVLWLVLAFFSSAGLFVLLGAEFVAMIMVIVYVGAVAVLFLFVVMMLDVDFVKLKAGMSSYLPVGLLIALVLLVQLGFAFGSWEVTDVALAQRGAVTPDRADVENTMALGDVLYTQYVLVFQLAGLILLVAMIGAIVLTLRHRPGVKRQNVLEQMYRDPKTAIVMKDVKPGQGL